VDAGRHVPWWRDAVVYQIYPRSFQDSGGDGVGDLPGIERRLDYLAWLGVDAVWISPFYRSPMADFGYDVSDYCDVDPLFGTLADADRLIAAVHERGMRLLVDWVPNHTSDQHPWFVDSRSSRSSPRRDWYHWRDGRGDGPPNNWRAAFGGRAWTFDERTGQWYLHLFLPQQPDLNWSNPEVVAAMHDVLRFWLDRGVDGFRIDVVHCIGKDPAFPDQPAELGEIDRVGIQNEPVTHELIRGFRQLVDAYPGDRTTVGEVQLGDVADFGSFYGAGDELHMVFNFLPLHVPWTRPAWSHMVERIERGLPAGGWPTWVLSNHDGPRVRTRLGNDAAARSAALLLLTLRGTPFIYQGDELGLEDAVVPERRRVDPGGRDGCRAPMPWDARPGHGWPGREPWLPWPPHAETRNVESETGDPASMLHLYRRLMAARRRSPALRRGDLTLRPAGRHVLAFERHAAGDRRLVLVNFGDRPAEVRLDGDWTVELATCDDEGPGHLPPNGGALLRPATTPAAASR
jgi:alpha-glucosidase